MNKRISEGNYLVKILVIHNRYTESGGEDVVAQAEVSMLRDAGHQVITYERANEEIKGYSLIRKAAFLINDIRYSKNTYKEVSDVIRREKPDIAHIHNIFFAASPSVYYALSDANIPVVHSIHNYRLFCLNGILYRNGYICEECCGCNFFPAVMHRCWRGSFILSFFLARAMRAHFKKQTFQKKVDAYITPGEFCKNKLIKAGLPKDKIFVKPYYTEISDKPRKHFQNYALFLGRLINYKGIYTVLAAYKKLKGYNLKIIGDGPLAAEVKLAVSESKNIELLGKLPYGRVVDYLKNAAFLIFPSECYEALPMVILEAFACGVPVLARDIGGIDEVIKDKENGLLFANKDSEDLAAKIRFLFEHKDMLIAMGNNARKTYEERYCRKENYEMLLSIYQRAIKIHQANTNALNIGIL